MSLTYDQKSEIRLAFDEAFVEPERRRSMRFKHITPAEICEWKRGRPGEPFNVQIEDFSPTGVGMIHGTELPAGGQYLIKVPRQKWGDLIVLMTVVRSAQRESGEFQIGLELSSVIDKSVLTRFVNNLQNDRLTSRRTKILFLMLGIVGLGLTLIIN